MASKRQRGPGKDVPLSSLAEESSLLVAGTPFPRGGGSNLTPLEIKLAAVEAANDLYEQTVAAAPPSKKHKKAKKGEAKQEASTTFVSRIDPLIFSKLTLGTILLGQVSEATPKRLKIALPNNLYGYVDASSDPDTIPFMDYSVGSWLRVTVIDLGEAPVKRLLLSLSPDLNNQTIAEDDLVPGMTLQGIVTSSEDRGAILDLGETISQTGFVSSKSKLFKKGEAVFGTIIKKTDRVITIDVGAQDKTKLKTIHEQPSLVPGTLVEVAVDEVLPTGVRGSIFGHIKVEVDSVHSGLLNGRKINVNDKLQSRIIFSIPPDNLGEHNRTLRASFLPNVVSLETSTQDFGALTIGQIIPEAKIVSVEPRLGLSLDIGLNKLAYAHILMLEDDNIEDLHTSSKFKVSTIHKCRVVGYSPLDDLYYIALAPKVLEQQYLSLQEIPLGAVTTAKVQRILPKGSIIMNLGGSVSGIVNENHLSDTKQVDPEKTFKIGKTFKIRVLEVDTTNYRLKLTCKKSLITWDGPLVSEITNDLVGKKIMGTVVSNKDNGAVLEFFGNVRGFLPSREMSDSNPPTSLYRGQSLIVYVLEADAEQNKLILSGRLPGGDFESLQSLEILSEQDARVIEKTQDGFVVDIEPEGARCFLPFTHLSDDMADAKAQSKKIKVGSLLTRSLVIGKRKGMGFITRKPKLLEAAEAGKLPSTVSDLERGACYVGFVANVNEELGAFVSFANNLVGLIPKAELAYKSINLKPGETVSAYVSSIKLEKSKFMLTLQADGGKSDEQFITGDLVDAVITEVKAMQLNVSVGRRQGRIDMTDLFDEYTQIQDPRRPLSQFSKGQVVQARVIGLHNVHNHHFLPISHRTATHSVLELSLKKSSKITTADLQEGASCLAFINNIATGGDMVYASVSPSIRGVISRLDLSTDPVELRNILEYFPLGMALECQVVATAPALRLTTAAAAESTLAIIHSMRSTGLTVWLPKWRTAIVAPTDSMDSYEELSEVFEVGDIVDAKFLECVDGKNWASLRGSVIHSSGKVAEITDPLINSAADLSVGDLVRGFVKNISDGGLFVELGRTVSGRVRIDQLSDQYLKDWKKEFKTGQVVAAKVMSKSADSRIELTLKESVVRGQTDNGQSLEDTIKTGMIFTGTVRRVEDFGVFVNLDNTKHSGLCHKSEIADRPLKNLRAVFTVGDPVKVKVLRVNIEKNQLSLGMKASYFDEQDSDNEALSDSVVVGSSDKFAFGGSDASDSEAEQQEVADIPFGSDCVEEGDDDDDDEESSEEESSAVMSDDEGLKAAFKWGGNSDDDGDDDDDDNEGQADAAFASSESDSSDSDSDHVADRRKRRAKPKGFVEDITGQLENKAPESAQDFERLLVSDPNSSVLWMKYMAYQTEQNEIDAARSIGRRALKEISHREEDERFNIWVALINLENVMGTPESTQEVFKEAVHYMDSCKMHLRVASIFDWSDKLSQADETYRAACRKFGSENLDVWLQYMKYLFKRNKLEEARKIFAKALSQAPKRMLKELSIAFAKLEFDNGDAERGRTIFEGLISTYPKKLDVWSTYADQEIKHSRSSGNRDVVEVLFGRMTQLPKLSMKQAKLIFKKWLAFEIDNEDVKGADKVKAKAAEFVQSRS